jgi:hypothetical protein
VHRGTGDWMGLVGYSLSRGVSEIESGSESEMRVTDMGARA